MIKKATFLYLLTTFVALAITGCKKPGTLKIGSHLWLGYDPVFVAREFGILDKKIVRIIEYGSASQTIRAFRNGLIDAAALTLDEVLQVAQYAPDIKILLIANISDGADAIIGKPYINSIQDIAQKRVGLEKTALGGFFLTRALERFHIDPSGLKLISADINEHEALFNSGRIDAIVTYQPVKSHLLSGGGRLLFDSSQLKDEIVDVVIIRKSFLEDNPGSAAHLVYSWQQAVKKIQNKEPKVFEYLRKRQQLSDRQLDQVLKEIKIPGPDGNRDILSNGRLVKVAGYLNKIMLRDKLISAEVNVENLPAKKFWETNISDEY